MTDLQYFEFRIFPAGDAPQLTEWHASKSEGGAKAKAGRLAMRHDGPVDVARYGSGGNADWGDRYLTTASPSPFHAAGYRFERLES